MSAGAARRDRAARLKQLGLFSLQRLLMLVTVLWLVATAVFFMLRFVPGGPFAQQSERDIPERVLRQLEAKMGLDQPLWKQYFLYIGNLACLDLGVSMTIEAWEGSMKTRSCDAFGPQPVTEAKSLRRTTASDLGASSIGTLRS